MDGVVLRRAESGDAERLSALGYATFRETFLDGFAIPYPAEDLAAFVAATYTPEAFARKLADPRQMTWIVERQGEAVAYANAGPCGLPHPQVEPGHLELHRLYILRAAQGSGLGRTLLETALGWMEAQSSGPLWLGVWSGNLKAQRLYEAYGFRKVGGYPFPVGTWRDDEFILRKDRLRG
jgi:diamine N-acetyltransferase